MVLVVLVVWRRRNSVVAPPIVVQTWAKHDIPSSPSDVTHSVMASEVQLEVVWIFDIVLS